MDALEIYDGFYCGVLWWSTVCEGSKSICPTGTPLQTDFILIYELLFLMTYSIFISYIYLFWEYIFSGMRLNKNKKSRKKQRIFFIHCPYLQMLHLFASLDSFEIFMDPVCFYKDKL